MTGDAANPHGVLRVTSAVAATVPEGFRLPSEAEWEWLARRGADSTWLSGDDGPTAWGERTLAAALTDDGHPFGVHGLGWGEWADDGWHPTYRGAPATSQAWDPMSRPEVVRGGGLALWPWQSGEVLLSLTAARDRAGPRAAHAVRLVRNLPSR
jgi:formylglycine-generating enzyme required for sulfatase activity